ncbi:hypothetical protein AGMMS49940_08220 [Spirochaetia bacterium]|nr:hypothetical protein AGMMS49940_08220 [Spirochaetia bacterium]
MESYALDLFTFQAYRGCTKNKPGYPSFDEVLLTDTLYAAAAWLNPNVPPAVLYQKVKDSEMFADELTGDSE